MSRTLSPEEEIVVKELWQKKSNFQDTLAYVTTTQEIELKKWNGTHPVEKNSILVKIPSGSTLKIVMISRFGDVGLTDNLNAVNGYHTRVPVDDDSITDIRFEREGKPGPSRYDLLKRKN
jgi:hypothetical protein